MVGWVWVRVKGAPVNHLSATSGWIKCKSAFHFSKIGEFADCEVKVHFVRGYY